MLFALTSCSSTKQAAQSPNASPAPLRSCELRALTIDAAELIVESNADGTLASVTVVKAPDEATRVEAIDDVLRRFGPARRDARIVAHQSRWWGLTTYTDPCGHPVTPLASPSPAR